MSLDATKMTGWKIEANNPTTVVVDSYWNRFQGYGGSCGIKCHTAEQARLIAAAPEMLDFIKHVAGASWADTSAQEWAEELVTRATHP